MAVTWSTTDKHANITLSGSNLVSTLNTFSGLWTMGRATNGHNASNTGGVYAEFLVGSVDLTKTMLGLSQASDPIASTYTGTNVKLHHSENALYGSPATGSGVTWGAAGDRIGVLLKNNKIYFRKNGTWMNSGNPAAETGYMFYNVVGVYYPTVIYYSPVNSGVTLCVLPSDIVGSIPTGAVAWGSSLSLTTTLVDSSGSPLASTSVSWAVFVEATPSTLATIDRTGTGTTDGSGVLTISYDATRIPAGATCSVLVSTTLRFNIQGASYPVWFARCTLPGPIDEPSDSCKVELRGDAD